MSIKLIAKIETFFKSVDCDDSYEYYNAEHDYFDEEAYHDSICAGYQIKCEEYLFNYLYPDKRHICPKCGKPHKLGRLVKHIHCTYCGHKSHWLAGTVFYRSNIPLIKWFKFFAYSTDTRVDNRYIAKILRLNLNTITSMSGKLCEAKTMYGLEELFSEWCGKSTSTLTRFSYIPRDRVKQRLRIAASAREISSPPPSSTVKPKHALFEIKYEPQCKNPEHEEKMLKNINEKLTVKEFFCFEKTGALPSRLLAPPEKDTINIVFSQTIRYLRKHKQSNMLSQEEFNKVAKLIDDNEQEFTNFISKPGTSEREQWILKMCIFKIRQWKLQHSNSYDIYQIHKREEERRRQAVEIHKNKTNIMREFIDSHQENQNKFGTAFQEILAIKDTRYWLERRDYAPLYILADYAENNLSAAS